MKKCPRCKKEIADRYQYCPHCGYNLKQNNHNKFKPLVYVLVFGIPFLYYLLLSDVDVPKTNNNKIVLEEVEDRKATAILYQYDSLEDFSEKVEDADEYIQTIKEYEAGINSDASKEYLVSILDNHDVNFKLSYTFNEDNLLVNIHKQYTISESLDYLEYTFTLENITSLKDIVVNGDVMGKYVDVKEFETLYHQLLLREEEFNKKIENIGHYGFGEYSDYTSIVVYPDGDHFKVVFKHKSMN